MATMTLTRTAAALSAVANEALTGDSAGLPTDDRTGVAIGVLSFILPFTASVVALRFYTRHFLSRTLGVDDWVLLIALIFAIVDGLVMCLMVTQGLGRHIWTLSPETVETYNMYFYLSIIFYYLGLGTVKTAILLQYLRFFAVKMRKITLVVMALLGLWSTGLVLVSIFACHPIRGFWDKDINATCVKELPQWYVNAGGNIVTDVIIFTLPIPVLWKLSLPLSQRLSLIGVFCLGFFACTISVIRITFLDLGGDDTYTNMAAACWSIGELCCGIVCSCLPTLRPVLFRVLPKSIKRSRQQYRSGGIVGGGGGRGIPRDDDDRQSSGGRHSVVKLKSVRSSSGSHDDHGDRGFGGPQPSRSFGVDTNNPQSWPSPQPNRFGQSSGHQHQHSSYDNRLHCHFHSQDSGYAFPMSTLANSSKNRDGSGHRESRDSRGSEYSYWHSIISHYDSDKTVLEAAAVETPKLTHQNNGSCSIAQYPPRPSIRDLVSVGVTSYRSGRNSRSSSPLTPPAGHMIYSRTDNLARMTTPPAAMSNRAPIQTYMQETSRTGDGSALYLGADDGPETQTTTGNTAGASRDGAQSAIVPPRSYSYGQLRRMAAAMGAGVGAAVNGAAAVAGGVAAVSANNSISNNSSFLGSHGSYGSRGSHGGSAGTTPGSPGLPHYVDAQTPDDPPSSRWDAYVGLRQGIVTSIQAGRPSVSGAATGELPAGPGIQIRREVAQNVELSDMV